jgi:hypothetical protein
MHPWWWPTWWLIIPTAAFCVALLITVLPLMPRKPGDSPSAASPPSPIAPPLSPRTGLRQHGGSVKFGQARIRNQDIGMDLEGTELTVEDLDIE